MAIPTIPESKGQGQQSAQVQPRKPRGRATVYNISKVTVYVNAHMAGLISKDQEDMQPEDVEVKGDMANLIQFVELMYQQKDLDDDFEDLKKYMEEKIAENKKDRA
jgi:transcriptional regulator with GAF, ATPase, and Fis domain